MISKHQAHSGRVAGGVMAVGGAAGLQESQRVIDAVIQATDNVAIIAVDRAADGTYAAVGTSANGSTVAFCVSTDRKTITAAA